MMLALNLINMMLNKSTHFMTAKDKTVHRFLASELSFCLAVELTNPAPTTATFLLLVDCFIFPCFGMPIFFFNKEERFPFSSSDPKIRGDCLRLSSPSQDT